MLPDKVVPTGEHVPVLLEEVLANLVQAKSGVYVDATFGRGGHARKLLTVLDANARLIVIDRDPSAIEVAHKLAAEDARISVFHARFSELAEVLDRESINHVDGVLLDLGVSSPQLDDAARGFSFRADGPLDMRMNPNVGVGAAQWLDEASQDDIAFVIRTYGEERFAGRIARAIIAARPLETTEQLAKLVAAAVPARLQNKKHPATKTFQAVRMHVNQEPVELELGLVAGFAALAPGGRLAVISFHSLEDRAVKHAFRKWTKPPVMPRRVPIRHADMTVEALDVVGPLRAGTAELRLNPRARSATLRVIQKEDPHVAR